VSRRYCTREVSLLELNVFPIRSLRSVDGPLVTLLIRATS
jgi:hypothetical protein